LTQGIEEYPVREHTHYLFVVGKRGRHRRLSYPWPTVHCGQNLHRHRFFAYGGSPQSPLELGKILGPTDEHLRHWRSTAHPHWGEFCPQPLVEFFTGFQTQYIVIAGEYWTGNVPSCGYAPLSLGNRARRCGYLFATTPFLAFETKEP
jgi:hypothetical protein